MAKGTTDVTLPAAGDLLAGKYRIERLIGQGGMGAVFAAQHELLFQRVAIKLLLSGLAKDPNSVGRFLNEARAMARIQDEHVARVMDIGTLENGTAFMVLEYLDGIDLSNLLSTRGPLPLREVIEYAVQALEGLAQAHGLGIVHRDIKPSNLFLARRPNGSSCVKLLDFGISKGANPFEEKGSVHTSTGAIMGSPEYMSPEQLRNSKTVDARTDIWSLGVVIYELLTGQPPFTGETLGEILTAIVEAEVPPLQGRADVPAAFEAVLLRCMARKPEQRFASAAALAAALRPFASPAALASIHRLCETHPPQVEITAAPALPAQAPAPVQTGASWAPAIGIARPEPSRRKGPDALILAIGGIALVGAAAGFAIFGSSKAQPSPASQPEAHAAPPATTALSTVESTPATEATDAGSATTTLDARPNAAAASVVVPAVLDSPHAHTAGNKGGSPRNGATAPLPHAVSPDRPPSSATVPTYDPSRDSRK